MKALLFYNLKTRKLSFFLLIFLSALFVYFNDNDLFHIFYVFVYPMNILTNYVYKDKIKTDYGEIDGSYNLLKKTLPLSKKDIIFYNYILVLIYGLVIIVAGVATSFLFRKTLEFTPFVLGILWFILTSLTLVSSSEDIDSIFPYNKNYKMVSILFGIYLIACLLYIIYIAGDTRILTNGLLYLLIFNTLLYVGYFIFNVLKKEVLYEV